MKRHGNLWLAIVDFDNLLQAARQAQQGKRFRANVLEFNFSLEQELFTLQSELQDHTYQPGAYRTFEIWEPKPGYGTDSCKNGPHLLKALWGSGFKT